MNGVQREVPVISLASVINSLVALEPEPLPLHLVSQLAGPQAPVGATAALPGPALLEQPQVARVVATQWADGSWGGFHSADRRRKQYPPTTEVGVRLCLALGLRSDSSPLVRARAYLEGLLRGDQEMPDRPELNKRWPVGKEMFVASTLALIDPGNSLLQAPLSRWAQVVTRAFRDGAYSLEAEKRAQEAVHGIRVELRYLQVSNRYCAELLGSASSTLSPAIRRAYAEWLCTLPDGIGYLGVPVLDGEGRLIEGSASPKRLHRWFESLLIILGIDRPSGLTTAVLRWLRERQRSDGLWDFGAVQLPRLSASWRKQKDRAADHTVHVLHLLSTMGCLGRCHIA
jgi:hypothetical protein